jgi:hypothetical protein
MPPQSDLLRLLAACKHDLLDPSARLRLADWLDANGTAHEQQRAMHLRWLVGAQVRDCAQHTATLAEQRRWAVLHEAPLLSALRQQVEDWLGKVADFNVSLGLLHISVPTSALLMPSAAALADGADWAWVEGLTITGGQPRDLAFGVRRASGCDGF